jgi:hypothetical protein
MNNREKVSDATLEIAFGTTDPCLGRFPHCIFKGSDAAIETLAKQVSEPIAVWGDRPWYDATGKLYVPPWEPDPVHEFELWKLAPNQQCALHYSKYRNSSEFVMIVSANLSENVVKRPLERFNPEDGCFSYYKYIQWICDWIPEFGWAYIPLSDELDEAMLVVSRARQQLLIDMEAALHARSIPTGKLERKENRWLWPEVR